MKEVEQDIEKISQSSDGVKKVDFDKRSNTANLPSYERMLAIPMKIWTITGSEFITVVEISYEVIKWRKNIFKIPSGRSSKDLVNELTYWLDQYNRETEFHGVALKVFMLLPSLLLQKPSKNSKAKDHLVKLGERLNLWKEGKLNELLREGRTIQKRLLSTKQRSKEDSKNFHQVNV